MEENIDIQQTVNGRFEQLLNYVVLDRENAYEMFKQIRLKGDTKEKLVYPVGNFIDYMLNQNLRTCNAYALFDLVYFVCQLEDFPTDKLNFLLHNLIEIISLPKEPLKNGVEIPINVGGFVALFYLLSKKRSSAITQGQIGDSLKFLVYLLKSAKGQTKALAWLELALAYYYQYAEKINVQENTSQQQPAKIVEDLYRKSVKHGSLLGEFFLKTYNKNDVKSLSEKVIGEIQELVIPIAIHTVADFYNKTGNIAKAKEYAGRGYLLGDRNAAKIFIQLRLRYPENDLSDSGQRNQEQIAKLAQALLAFMPSKTEVKVEKPRKERSELKLTLEDYQEAINNINLIKYTNVTCELLLNGEDLQLIFKPVMYEESKEVNNNKLSVEAVLAIVNRVFGKKNSPFVVENETIVVKNYANVNRKVMSRLSNKLTGEICQQWRSINEITSQKKQESVNTIEDNMADNVNSRWSADNNSDAIKVKKSKLQEENGGSAAAKRLNELQKKQEIKEKTSEQKRHNFFRDKELISEQKKQDTSKHEEKVFVNISPKSVQKTELTTSSYAKIKLDLPTKLNNKNVTKVIPDKEEETKRRTWSEGATIFVEKAPVFVPPSNDFADMLHEIDAIRLSGIDEEDDDQSNKEAEQLDSQVKIVR